jgi:PAS domain S-box-containing protein
MFKTFSFSSIVRQFEIQRGNHMKQEMAGYNQAEEELRLTQFCIDKASIGIYLISEEGNIRSVNDYACASLGYSREELCAMTVFDIDPTFSRQIFIAHRSELYTSGSRTFETIHRRKDNTTFPVEITVNFLEFSGKKLTVSFAKDITERKRADERIRASLTEKEILLKEIHHRVKNNLQIISTLLDLQSDSIRDEHTLNLFRESQDRIRTMALVHEQLYNSRDLAYIDFSGYAERLVSSLYQSYVEDTGRIGMKVEVRGVELMIDQAIPCGLIINELVSNAIKYAFPGQRSGEIIVSGRTDDDGWVVLTVADNGAGLPQGFDWARAETLGLQIVSMLTRQLRGTLDLGEGSGASFMLRFRRKGND